MASIRTELEKAIYTGRQIANRIKELGGDPSLVFMSGKEGLPKKEQGVTNITITIPDKIIKNQGSYQLVLVDQEEFEEKLRRKWQK